MKTLAAINDRRPEVLDALAQAWSASLIPIVLSPTLFARPKNS
jgi:hypothetical protein